MSGGMPVYWNKQSPYDAWTGERLKIWYADTIGEWRLGREAASLGRLSLYYVCRGAPGSIRSPFGWLLQPDVGLGSDNRPIKHPSATLPAPQVTFPGQPAPMHYPQAGMGMAMPAHAGTAMPMAVPHAGMAMPMHAQGQQMFRQAYG
jgi:hypothetical protein